MEEYEQIVSYLDKTSQILVSLLEKALPELSPDWRVFNVVAELSYAQGNRVRDKGIRSFSGLDLVAFLRVFNQNWSELNSKNKLYYEDNHLLKEMYKIRNWWAYKPMSGYKQDDIYRNLDTIQRFIALIDADNIFINQIIEELY